MYLCVVVQWTPQRLVSERSVPIPRLWGLRRVWRPSQPALSTPAPLFTTPIKAPTTPALFQLPIRRQQHRDHVEASRCMYQSSDHVGNPTPVQGSGMRWGWRKGGVWRTPGCQLLLRLHIPIQQYGPQQQW